MDIGPRKDKVCQCVLSGLDRDDRSHLPKEAISTTVRAHPPGNRYQDDTQPRERSAAVQLAREGVASLGSRKVDWTTVCMKSSSATQA